MSNRTCFRRTLRHRRAAPTATGGVAFAWSMLIMVSTLSALTVLTRDAQADGLGYDGLPPQELCGLCHGLNGISATSKFPHLAGQKPAYIEKQLHDFVTGRRKNGGGQMVNIVTEIQPEQFAVAARHFAQQVPPEPDHEAATALSPAAVTQAGDIYASGVPDKGIPACATCHDQATVVAPATPWLKSQRKAYLEKQLHDFKSGARDNDTDRTMRTIAAKLSTDQIERLAAYLASQPRNGD